MYPEHAAPGDVAIYQFTTSSAVAGYLAEHGLPLILDFHNFTGPGVLRRLGAPQRGAGGGGGRRAGAAGPAGAARAGQEPVQRAGAPARRLPAHRGRPGAGRLRARDRQRPTRGWRRSWRSSSAEGGADILFVGRIVPSKAQHELVKALVGLPPALRREGPPAPGRRHLELRVHQGAAGLRATTSACPPRCGCRARCRTRRWPPTSPPPTSTSRCRRTRGSGSRSSRR